MKFLGNHSQAHQQHHQYPNNIIHTGSIPATGRSNYASASSSSFPPIPANPIVDKSVEDTRMIIEQSNRLMVKNNCGGMIDDKIVIPANSYIDQPMLSAMQAMFNNTNGLHATGNGGGGAVNHQNVKTHVYQPQQIYFN